MTTPIHRDSLVSQVIDILRRELPRYRRFKWLPGERILCERFQISRTTLRAVLAQLKRQGLIRAVPSQGYRIQANVLPSRKRSTRIIGCLQEASLHNTLEPHSQILIRNVEHILNAAGYEMLVALNYRILGRNHGQHLASIVAAHTPACWALLNTSLETQRWFVRHDIPALLMGSCHPGISLPNMDINYSAICRHAVALFWRHGHRRIAFLTPRDRLGGDILSEMGFAEGWRQMAGPAVPPQIIHHDGSVVGISRSLDLAWTGAATPTALLVSRSPHALTAAGYLMRRGLHLPQDVSLVCRDSDDFLGRFIPTIAQYAVDWNAFARRCARSLIQLATAGRLRPNSRLVMACFMPGETVGPPGTDTSRRPIL